MPPKSLKPCNAHSILEEQLKIKVKTVLLILLFVLLCGIVAFAVIPPTNLI